MSIKPSFWYKNNISPLFITMFLVGIVIVINKLNISLYQLTFKKI